MLLKKIWKKNKLLSVFVTVVVCSVWILVMIWFWNKMFEIQSSCYVKYMFIKKYSNIHSVRCYCVRVSSETKLFIRSNRWKHCKLEILVGAVLWVQQFLCIHTPTAIYQLPCNISNLYLHLHTWNCRKGAAAVSLLNILSDTSSWDLQPLGSFPRDGTICSVQMPK